MQADDLIVTKLATQLKTIQKCIFKVSSFVYPCDFMELNLLTQQMSLSETQLARFLS